MVFTKGNILTMNGMDLAGGLLQMEIIILASGEMECETVGADMFITRLYLSNLPQGGLEVKEILIQVQFQVHRQAHEMEINNLHSLLLRKACGLTMNSKDSKSWLV